MYGQFKLALDKQLTAGQTDSQANGQTATWSGMREEDSGRDLLRLSFNAPRDAIVTFNCDFCLRR